MSHCHALRAEKRHFWPSVCFHVTGRSCSLSHRRQLSVFDSHPLSGTRCCCFLLVEEPILQEDFPFQMMRLDDTERIIRQIYSLTSRGRCLCWSVGHYRSCVQQRQRQRHGACSVCSAGRVGCCFSLSRLCVSSDSRWFVGARRE